MTQKIDAKNQSCPAPVLMTKQVVESESPASLAVMVDNDAARQNVTKYFESQGYDVTVNGTDGLFEVTGTLGTEANTQANADQGARPEVKAEANSADNNAAAQKKIMIMVATDRIGFGDDTLGQKLMASYIKTLKEIDGELWRIVFVNNGVKLTIGDSPVIDDLKELEASGVDLLVCGACLTHFNLMDKKDVGQVTNMLDIVTSMQLADSVVNI